MGGFKRFIRILLLLTGLLMLVTGILDGSFRDVWTKAAMVCLECVGIG